MPEYVYSTGVKYTDGMGRNQNAEISQYRAFNRRIWRTEKNKDTGKFLPMTFSIAQNRGKNKTHKDISTPASSDYIRYKKTKALISTARRLK